MTAVVLMATPCTKLLFGQEQKIMLVDFAIRIARSAPIYHVFPIIDPEVDWRLKLESTKAVV